jgi:predicted GIY-YIG superfamily endonuclease
LNKAKTKAIPCNLIQQKIKNPAAYMISNKRDGVIYTGYTSDLKVKVEKQKNKS